MLIITIIIGRQFSDKICIYFMVNYISGSNQNDNRHNYIYLLFLMVCDHDNKYTHYVHLMQIEIPKNLQFTVKGVTKFDKTIIIFSLFIRGFLFGDSVYLDAHHPLRIHHIPVFILLIIFIYKTNFEFM